MTTARQILVEARAILRNPKAWTKGLYAKNRRGKSVQCNSEQACQFCSIGALRAASSTLEGGGTSYFTSGYYAAHYRLEHIMDGEIVSFNDHPERAHEDVISAFDVAIEGLVEDEDDDS